MTRINVVPPSELHDKHLLAEYRELPRVFGASKKWHARGGRVRDLPKTYRLGKGHVLFFYDKLQFCFSRQMAIYKECKRRGFNVQYAPSHDLIGWAPNYLLGNYLPTRAALRINRQRIRERLATMKA
ncbi:MAG: endonuclease [Gammaproteobacteria bacterium]|nr:MAG: endonuclease [Gammaproteobacteria bacterium]